MWVFYCFSGGYEEICEGCESKKSKIAVHARVCAREETICVENLMIWSKCFSERKQKLPHRRWRSWIEIVSMVAT